MWPLTAHGGGIIILSQILLDVGEERITGAGPGLANARILLYGPLTELLKSPPPPSQAVQVLGRSELPVARRCAGCSDGAHMSPAAVHKSMTMLYSSLGHDQLHLCSALLSPGQRRNGCVPAEWRRAPSPVTTRWSSGCSWCCLCPCVQCLGGV